ncbi:hypothetical protein O9993_21650 [Vibrio lentus]|nr:hypothetical protein [Vibrio lentus]
MMVPSPVHLVRRCACHWSIINICYRYVDILHQPLPYRQILKSRLTSPLKFSFGAKGRDAIVEHTLCASKENISRNWKAHHHQYQKHLPVLPSVKVSESVFNGVLTSSTNQDVIHWIHSKVGRCKQLFQYHCERLSLAVIAIEIGIRCDSK